MKRGFTLAFAAVAAATLALGGAIAQQRAIAIGTGGTGGVYYPIGGGAREPDLEDLSEHAGDRTGHRRFGR